VIAHRLEVARQEIEAGREFDITLVNTSVKDVCRQLVTLMTA
jgi:guanylate kinase